VIAAAWGGSAVPRLAGMDGLEPRGAIDTTPFTGVVLVLLIIYMVITPAFGEGPYLPRAATAEVIRGERLELGIDEQGRYYVDNRPIPDTALDASLRHEIGRMGADELLLIADKDVSYSRVETALRTLQAAGVRRVMVEVNLPRPRARVTVP
jgi:biopolymer transport protein TolR